MVEKNSGPADPSEIESGGSVGACLAWNTIRQLYYVQSLSFKKKAKIVAGGELVAGIRVTVPGTDQRWKGNGRKIDGIHLFLNGKLV